MGHNSSFIQPAENTALLKMLRSSISHLREESGAWQSLLDAQPALIEHFLMTQAGVIAEAIVHDAAHVQFSLPDKLVIELLPDGRGEIGYLPAGIMEQTIGGWIDHLVRGNMGAAVRQRLRELAQAADRPVSVSAGLLQHAIAVHMVHKMLPSGRSVTYAADEGEEIPSIPIDDDLRPLSALVSHTDAIAEQGSPGEERAGTLAPFVPSAQRFYLPRWIAFDDRNRLLVSTLAEAEAHVGSMQRYVGILHAAVALAPYIVADVTYQSKRYGMLGQLVNQARALARYETSELIRTISRRAAAHDLNRGLSLSLPYFDDQALEMRILDFDVIPPGRIMFIPAFVVQACEEQRAKVGQDTRLSPSTRRHLLDEINTIQEAFPPRGGRGFGRLTPR